MICLVVISTFHRWRHCTALTSQFLRFDLEALNDLYICSNSVCAPGQVQQVFNVNTGILETVMLEKSSDAFLSKLQL